jgi:SAM-dependent methyltransferase
MSATGPASAESWRTHLEAWAIPDEVLESAPESPWGFPPELFRRSAALALADTAPGPSRLRAAEALPAGGTVLDVGAGAGAASLPLVPPATRLVAVDESKAMLEAFAEGATGVGVVHEELEGRWPDIAASAPACDVVVCHHVLYNVPDIAPFVQALAAHARRRVVLEMTATHPQEDLSPLWLSLHGIIRPTRPTADDAAGIVSEMGFGVHSERFERPGPWSTANIAERVAFARRRLCVGPEHDPEIEEFVRSVAGAPRIAVTLWWDSD